MTNTIGLKKKLLVCLLAAAMGASAVTGGVLLDASAESVALTNLVTVTGDAQVQTAPQQYKLKNNGKDGTPAGTAVGDTGLYVASTKDDSADGYTVALNGIFTGSVGMQIAFPGEGFWDGSYREAVMTVASINDPAEQFQLHLDDVWGMYAYVTYDYEGQTLVRSRSKYYGDPFDPVTGSETGDWLYYKDTDSYYFPVMGVFQDAGTKADPRRETSYFGLEMTADGALNVILTANKGDWGEPYKRVLASFAEDPETFEPKMEGKGSTPNLPKLESFKDGYTISFEVSDNANNKACDFLLESIAVSNSGDAYRSENNGTVYTLNTETLDAPSFYTKWKTTPMLTFGDYEYLNSSYVGAEITLPVPSVVQAGQPSQFTGTVTVTDSEGEQSVAAENGTYTYTVRSRGAHTVSYKQGDTEKEITFNAYDEPYDIDDVMQDVQGAEVSYEKDIRNLQGITLTGTDGGFSGRLAGSFSGNMSIDFEFPHQFNDANTGNGVKFTFTVYDANGNAAFDIVYENAGGWYTAVYVKMGDKIRTFIEDGSYDNWSGDKGTMFYAVPTGDRCNIYPGAGLMYAGLGQDETRKYGTLQLVWEGNVLNVRATDRNGNLFTFAEFDGSESYSAKDLDTQSAVILDMTEERLFGLPMMDGSDSEGVDLTQGYSIGFSSSSKELPVTFLSVNGVSLANRDNLTTDYVFSASIDPDQASVSGKDVYVAQGLHVGKVRRVYSYAFMGAANEYAGSWGIRHEIVESDFDSFHKNTEVNDYEVTIPAEGGENWAGMDVTFDLHIETAWKLSFDLQKGQVAEGSADTIVYSEHTKFLLTVPEAERAFWQFDGWSTQSDLSDTWDGSFDTWSGDMTLYAKWKDVTPATVVPADGIAEYTQVLVTDGSFTISKKDVVASDAAQPDAVTLTVKYRQGAGEWTTLEGESVTIESLTPGTWEIVYTVNDGVNGDVAFTRTVSVVERAAPVVTVGEIAAEAYAGFAVKVPATAADADDNAVEVKVTVVDENGKQYAVTGGAFTPDKAGVYTVSFTAQDGTLIGYASCRVTVIADTQSPVLTVDFADKTVDKGSEVRLPSGAAQDNADPDVTVTVSVSFGTKKVELSGNSFKAAEEGTYTVTWTAQDSAGNTSTVTAYITVQPAQGGNLWLIVGICAGVVVVAAAVAVIVIVVKKKKAGAQDASENE